LNRVRKLKRILAAGITSRSLRAFARWIFLAALIFAPWDYGATTAPSIVTVNWLLGSALAIRIIAAFFPHRDGRTATNLALRAVAPRILIGATVAILIMGWWMVFNAKAIYDSSYFVFVPLPHFKPRMPGSIDYAISIAWMVRATLLLGVIWFVVELSRNPRWLLRLWWTIALAGGSIALLGLLQKATGAEMIFWQPNRLPVLPFHHRGTPAFFATYYYHGNAGAFLNLMLPATAGLTVRVFTRPAQPVVRAIALTLLITLVVAIFANTSRMSELIGAVLLLILVVRFTPTIFRGLSKTEISLRMAGIAAVVFAVYAVAQASHLERSLSRWQGLSKSVLENPRWMIAKRAFDALPETGTFGTGPGTFRALSPRYTIQLPEPARLVWRFLHEDYLQTLMEWGWVGGFFWAAIFFGGIGTGVQSLRQEKFRRTAKINARDHHVEFGSEQTMGSPQRGTWEWTPRQRLFLSLSLLALTGVAVHALVDFPLQIASLQLYAATFLGVCWGSSAWTIERKAQKAKMENGS
jgi:O-antigen ligase/polysaccharide polymerase Wzy-like membrane protein